MPRRGGFLLQAGCGGVLYALGHVGFGFWPLIFIFLVPLWRVLDAIENGHAGKAALAGLVFGLAAFATGFPWLLHLIDVFFDGNRLLGILLWIACGVWFALGFSVYGIIVCRLRMNAWPIAISGTAPLLLMEWLQPQLFPNFAGAALIQILPLAQVADLGGPLLLTAVVALVNGFCYRVWLRLQGADIGLLRASVATTLLVGSVFLYGLARQQSLAEPGPEAQPLRVGMVQANLGGMEKRRLAIEGHRRHLQQTRELLRAAAPLDLIIWPETAYTRAIRRPLPVDAQTIREDITTPLLFGGTSVWQENGRRRGANSVFLARRDGTIDEIYDKNMLIPLAEFVPFGNLFPRFKNFFPHTQNFQAGDSTPALHLDQIAMVTPICYEVIEPEFVRKMVRSARPQLLVTLASDAWFGDTQEPWIHLDFARLRAIEHRLWLIRSTTSGISAIVDPSGAVIAQTGLFTRENLAGEVYPRTTMTWYARLGPWPGWLALVVTLLALAVRFRLTLRSKSTRTFG